ncbi:MAG: DUF2085 domain-containing protein [Anaerolineae bacterium]
MEPKYTDVQQTVQRRPRLTAVVLALALLVIVLFIMIPPASVLGKADLVGYGICHRLPERSFFLNGRQLPLCARCTGTFLGAVLGLTAMLVLGRRRASRLPPVPVLGILVMFTTFWAFDGLNSYMTFFPGAPHLYEPQNWLRLTTGLLNGLTLVSFAFPIFNFTMWREPSRERVLKNARELLVILPFVAILVLVIHAEIDILLYPLAILSSLGVLMMLTLINSMVAAVVLGREGYAESWRQAVVPMTVGLGLALLMLLLMVGLRAYLTVKLGLPF